MTILGRGRAEAPAVLELVQGICYLRLVPRSPRVAGGEVPCVSSAARVVVPTPASWRLRQCRGAYASSAVPTTSGRMSPTGGVLLVMPSRNA